MASHLDIEEQEQLDELKHFWKRWGDLITWVLIAVLGSYAAWMGWQSYQGKQAAQSAALYDTVERAALSGDTALLDRSVSDIKDKFASTTYAQQAALLAARVYNDKDRKADAKAQLSWVIEKASDEGYQALARLRLAALLVEDKAYDEARKQLTAKVPEAFAPLMADRLGLSLIHISEPTRPISISYAVFCLKKNNFFNDTATTEIYTLHIVGSVRCV